MPDINSGTPTRWENGGAIKIDTGTSYAILMVQSGSVSFQTGLKAREPWDDRGVFAGVLEGDERLSTVELEVKCAAASFDATNVVKLARSTSSSGAITLYDVVIDIPDYRGGGGKRITFNECFLPEGEQWKAAGPGAAPDTIKFTFKSLDAEPVETDYT
jgi:hypothetical protein